MTLPLHTNRDLYLAIADLSKQQIDCQRTLEIFLLAVLSQSSEYGMRASLTLVEFYELIACGFTHDPAPFDDEWRIMYDKLPSDERSYAGWRATVIQQIVDLREMDECGMLENELRYFGIEAPRHSQWYNFAPASYLECAAAGSFGGWNPGDETGRQYVPGQVAVLTEDGAIQSADPQNVPNPQFGMPAVTWEQFKDFVFCGQTYE